MGEVRRPVPVQAARLPLANDGHREDSRQTNNERRE